MITNFLIKKGKYLVAVSGGVDSVVLLDLLSKQSDLELIVAHFDHGIREDSSVDRIFVEKLAKNYDLAFEYRVENLGKHASEELARERRYKFLYEIADRYKADRILTAHHKDDLEETTVFNLLRGTGRQGVSSLKSNEKILRPLLDFTKQEIIDYAKQNGLTWREDSTNSSDRYTRNRIRKSLADMPDHEKVKIRQLTQKVDQKNSEIDELLLGIFYEGFDQQSESFDREFFVSLPHVIAKEVLVFWLKKEGLGYDKNLIEKLVNDLKTLSSNRSVDISKGRIFVIDKKQISIQRKSSV